MTSSVLPRNEKLTLLDDMFEKVVLSFCLVSCFDTFIFCPNHLLCLVTNLKKSILILMVMRKGTSPVIHIIPAPAQQSPNVRDLWRTSG